MSTPQLIENCLKIKPEYRDFLDLYTYSEKVVTVLDFLSRIDGQAVMPFLDVETKDWKESKDIYLPDNKVIPAIWTGGFSMENTAIVSKDEPEYTMKQIYRTLDHLLYREFTEALRVGKGFDLALQHINQLYIDHFYV